jgi:hypothetical protein
MATPEPQVVRYKDTVDLFNPAPVDAGGKLIQDNFQGLADIVVDQEARVVELEDLVGNENSRIVALENSQVVQDGTLTDHESRIVALEGDVGSESETVVSGGFIVQGVISGAIYSDNLPIGVVESDLGLGAIDIQSSRALATNIAKAAGSVALGKDVKLEATDTDAIAIGNGASVGWAADPITFPNIGSIAIGAGATTEEREATAVGYQSYAGYQASTALGSGAGANNAGATAIGYATDADGIDSFCMGANGYAQGDDSIVIGTTAYAADTDAVAIGSQANALGGLGTVALGALARGDNDYATAIGYDSWARAARSSALGYQAEVLNALHTDSTAIGTGATVTAANQIMLGTATETVVVPGQLLAADGSQLAPSIAFTSDPDVGFFYESFPAPRISMSVGNSIVGWINAVQANFGAMSDGVATTVIKDPSDQIVFELTSRVIDDASFGNSGDFDNRQLLDPSGFGSVSIDWGNRELYDSGISAILNWATSGEVRAIAAGLHLDQITNPGTPSSVSGGVIFFDSADGGLKVNFASGNSAVLAADV